jgi:hypothetical protein
MTKGKRLKPKEIVDTRYLCRTILQSSPYGTAMLPHHRLEEISSQRLGKSGNVDDWEARIHKLDQAGGLEDLMKMKPWTDPTALAPSRIPASIVYQFDRDQLLPIRF